MKKLAITKVQRKMLVILTLALVIPLAFAGGFALMQINTETKARNRQQIEAEVQRVNSVLFDLTLSIYTASESMSPTNTAMHLFAENEDSEELAQEADTVNRYINNYFVSTAACSSIEVYTNNPNVKAADYIHFIGDDSSEEWRRAIGSGEAAWAYLTRKSQIGEPWKELCLIRKIAVPSRTFHAYMVIRIDNNYLQNILGESSYEVDTLIKGKAFYSNNFENIGQKISIPQKSSPGIPTKLHESRKKLSAARSFQPYRTDSVLTTYVEDLQGPAHLSSMVRLYSLILLISVTVPMLIVALFSRSFGHRIEALRNAMRKVRDGNYQIVTEVEGDDELTETFRDLEITVQRIHQREKEYYSARLHEQELLNQQQKMEFKMLASQINPHFLYNTLEMIRMQALAGGNSQVAYSIKLLGKTMHYVLENTGSALTTLDRELDYVKSYLEIQKLRFGERLGYEIEVNNQIHPEEVHMLPLTLQPIAENAVIHGLKDVEEGGMIRISVSRDEGQIVFCVADNGPGMDQDTLKRIRKNLTEHDEEDTRSIGLYNVRKRVRLLYGSQADLTVDSCPGRGTVVTLVVPYSYELLKS